MNKKNFGFSDSEKTKSYLFFCAKSLLSLLKFSVRQIEKDDFTLCELYPIMEQLKNKINSRLNYKFFSSGAHASLNSEDSEASKNAIETDFCSALQRAVIH